MHPARHEDLALLDVFYAMSEQLGVDGFERQIEAIISRADSRPLLPKITIPTLVVVGKDDTLIPPDDGKEIAAGIPGTQLKEVELGAHMCMIERPETVTKLLAAFLD